MKKFILLGASMTIFIVSNAQTYDITTLAGNGTGGFIGDGGQATAAELNSPNGIAIDKIGNVYITDPGNNRIRKITNSGVISTFAGNGIAGYIGDGGQATAAEVSAPNSIMVDTLGNVYFSDVGNSTVRKINSSTIISTIAGTGTFGFSGDGGSASTAELNSPEGITLDNFGNIFIADASNNCIRQINSSGFISTFAGNLINGFSGDGGAATSAELNYPYGIYADATGNLFIADEFNGRIRKINTSNIISTIAGNGALGYSGDGGMATAAEFKYPIGVIMDESGNLLIADANNSRVRLINSGGIISTVAGIGIIGYSGDGGSATSAELSNPDAITLSSAGKLLIADDGNNTIRELVNTTGINELTETNSMGLFPNPNNGLFTIDISNIGVSSSIEIYNLLGEKVYTTHLNPLHGSNISIDISSQSSGIFLYSVYRKDGKVLGTGKIIKE